MKLTKSIPLISLKTIDDFPELVEIKAQFCYLETSSSCQIAQNL
jgi:hypothetical protein